MVAIDGADSRGVRDPNAYEWSDLYFKANKWETVEYPEKVLPITSGEITLRPRHIRFLKSLRHQEKTLDLVFISRIWPGPQDNAYEVVEHNVRLFEALSRVDCRKDLRAIIPTSLATDERMKDYTRRLRESGVRLVTGKIPVAELLKGIARGRTVFFRSGKHLAIPGRLLWYLCMGTCVIFDNKPYPQWYVPLLEGEHYVSCNCGLDKGEILPSNNDYDNVVDVIANLLANQDTIEAIYKNSSHYYDSYASPKKVAQYVLEVALGNIS